MLQKLGEQVRACYALAKDCARKAATSPTEEMCEDFLRLEMNWLFLARSYEFARELAAITAETKYWGRGWLP